MGVDIANNISERYATHQRKLPVLPCGTRLLILLADWRKLVGAKSTSRTWHTRLDESLQGSASERLPLLWR